jgi:hypothetical protein
MDARTSIVGLLVALAGCSSGSSGGGQGSSGASSGGGTMAVDPDTAPVVAVDRFSDGFAHLFARSKNPSLPAPNAAIDFDSGPPFITHGYGPKGEKIAYYNFDALPTQAAPIYVFFEQGDTSPVPGQLNVIDAVPGDSDYNDFWQVTMVTVPAGYVANSVTSLEEITKAGYPLTPTSMLVNCPVVPDGSTASLRYTSAEPMGLQRGWYRHQVVKYFTFAERALTTDGQGMVPLSPIYVSFNVNPDANDPASGPASGFMTESGSMMTHNVVATLPEQTGYSPLWEVNVYDDKAFASVSNLATALQAPVLAMGVADVNCPIVAKEQ